MEKHKWEKAWKDKRFNISTLTPSVLVLKYKNNFKTGARILDIGCGNGRNSIYLAKQGYEIDCFDVIDLKWRNNLSEDIKKKIHFKKSSLLEYSYKPAKYQAIIAARVIQYFDPTELSFLIDKIKFSLKPDGFLLLSYNTKGGIFNRKEIDVFTRSYPIERIEIILKTVFKNVEVKAGSKKSKYVNYVDDILTFDIYASEPHIPT